MIKTCLLAALLYLPHFQIFSHRWYWADFKTAVFTQNLPFEANFFSDVETQSSAVNLLQLHCLDPQSYSSISRQVVHECQDQPNDCVKTTFFHECSRILNDKETSSFHFVKNKIIYGIPPIAALISVFIRYAFSDFEKVSKIHVIAECVGLVWIIMKLDQRFEIV